MRTDTHKNAKSVEELKVEESERRINRHSRGDTDVKKGENRLRGTEQAGIQPRHGKPKGETDNSRK